MRGEIMKTKIFSLPCAVLLIIFLIIPLWGGDKNQGVTEPQSKLVTKLGAGGRTEAEVELEVWGIGSGKKRDQQTNAALLDAKRAACWYMLFGPEGILITSEQRDTFTQVAREFYDAKTVSQFISSISEIKDRVTIDKKKKKIKVRVIININRSLIVTWLEEHGIDVLIKSRAFIMVLPWVAKGGNPLEALAKSNDNRQAATAIQNHFPSERYEVKLPEAELSIQDAVKATDIIEDNPDDLMYRVALSQGADIYVTFEIKWEHSTAAGQRTIKATARINAYETSTAKLLGSQTGYSQNYPASTSKTAIIEEAMTAAITDVKNRIQKYWFDVEKNGAPFRVVVTISEDADEDAQIEIQDCFVDAIDEITMSSNENILTPTKIDYTVWADISKYESASKLERDIRDYFKKSLSGWKFRRRKVNKKLLIARVTGAE